MLNFTRVMMGAKIPELIVRYLTIEALEDGMTVSFTRNCEYCINSNEEWVSLTSGTASPELNTGQTISFRANLKYPSENGIGNFSISKKCNLKGNIMSLVYGDDAMGRTTGVKDYHFRGLFQNNSNIVNAKDLNLPARYVPYYGYRDMFKGCTSLVTAPKLPAITMNSGCYNGMFKNCESLIEAPKLNSTNIGIGCYAWMFSGCTSLQVAPDLPATTIKECCYQYMFEDCTSLVTPPSLPAVSLQQSCYSSMFHRCTSLVEAPILPAKTLATTCYSHMFFGCTNLKYINAAFTSNISEDGPTQLWLAGVASEGTFVKNVDATWELSGSSGIPEGWTVITE